MKTSTYYRILVSSYGLSTFSEGILMPIYAIFVQKIGGTFLDAAGAVATFFIVAGAAEMLIHKQKWSHRHRMPLMVFGWIVWLAGIFLYLKINSLSVLFIAQVLTALGNAIANPAFEAELAESTVKVIREYEYGIFDGLQDIFSGIAALIGGIVATAFGFNILIVLMVVTASISFLMILHYVWLKNRRAHSSVAAA